MFSVSTGASPLCSLHLFISCTPVGAQVLSIGGETDSMWEAQVELTPCACDSYTHSLTFPMSCFSVCFL